ncbi:MFS transporter [Croceicoccus sediminis]|uniref:MFS transporter n=1 Tax=Croceicoccus sediminis TaxID=2571150 RepID=UPI001181EFB4|nr:MFS transporter [Croceicoccus sediminis]
MIAKPETSARNGNGEAIRLIAIFLLGGLSNASLLCSPVIASQLGVEFAYSPEQVGWFFAAEYIGYIVAGLAARLILPRMNWRKLAALTLAGTVIGNLVAYTVLDEFMALIVVRALTASCSVVLATVIMATANESHHPSRAIGTNIMGQLAVGVVGLALLPPLFSQYGLQAYFFALAILLTIAAPGIFWIASQSRAKDLENPRQPVSVGRATALLRIPTILLFYVGLGGIWTFASSIAQGSMVGPDMVAWILSISAAVGVAGALLAVVMGRMTDLRVPIIPGFILLLAGTAALLLHTEIAFFSGLIVIKFAWSFVIPFAFSLIGRLDRDGGVIAEITIFGGIGLVAGPAIAGYLVSFDPTCVTLLWFELFVLTLSALSAIIMSLKFGKPTGQDQPVPGETLVPVAAAHSA